MVPQPPFGGCLVLQVFRVSPQFEDIAFIDDHYKKCSEDFQKTLYIDDQSMYVPRVNFSRGCWHQTLPLIVNLTTI